MFACILDLERKICLILAQLDWSLPFELICDTNDHTIGAYLVQRRKNRLHVIYYASKILTEAQRNYVTTKNELLSVIFAFDKFHSYLIVMRVIVYTNHEAIKFLLDKKDAKPRLI